MLAYTARRLPSALAVLFAASVAIFMILRLTPGDAATVLAGPDTTPETIAAIQHRLGLDEPLPAQYARWVTGLVSGDLGRSYILGAPISSLIGRAALNTIELTVASLILAIVVGLVVGTIGALSGSRIAQAAVTAYATVGFSVPIFILGILFVLIFAVGLRVLPSSGNPVPLLSDPGKALPYLVLPAITLSIPLSATISRFMMTSMRAAMEEEYIRTAISKGLSRRRVVLRHALPNAMPPVITIIGLQAGALLGGAVLVESVFAWPGLGRLTLQALTKRDYLLVQDLVIIAVAVFITVQVVTDLVYAALDPRIRLQR